MLLLFYISFIIVIFFIWPRKLPFCNLHHFTFPFRNFACLHTHIQFISRGISFSRSRTLRTKRGDWSDLLFIKALDFGDISIESAASADTGSPKLFFVINTELDVGERGGKEGTGSNGRPSHRVVIVVPQLR